MNSCLAPLLPSSSISVTSTLPVNETATVDFPIISQYFLNIRIASTVLLKYFVVIQIHDERKTLLLLITTASVKMLAQQRLTEYSKGLLLPLRQRGFIP